MPACRAGYLCHAGRCVSACNPPCEAGYTCSSGECLPPPPAAGPGYRPFPTGGPPPGADAPPPVNPLEGTAERHDGFMLRLTLGFGWGREVESASSIGGTVESSATGAAGSFSLDLGGALTDELSIHGRIASLAVVSPTIELGGEELGEADEVSISAALIGVGLTYYVMPANVYLTAVGGISQITFSNDGGDSDDFNTESGFGLNLDVGKEWWVSSQWGLGVAGRLWFTTLTHTEEPPIATIASIDSDFRMVGLTAQFSVTFQ